MAFKITIPSKALKPYMGYNITRRKFRYTNGTRKFTYVATPKNHNNQHVIEGKTLDEVKRMIRKYSTQKR